VPDVDIEPRPSAPPNVHGTSKGVDEPRTAAGAKALFRTRAKLSVLPPKSEPPRQVRRLWYVSGHAGAVHRSPGSRDLSPSS